MDCNDCLIITSIFIHSLDSTTTEAVFVLLSPCSPPFRDPRQTAEHSSHIRTIPVKHQECAAQSLMRSQQHKHSIAPTRTTYNLQLPSPVTLFRSASTTVDNVDKPHGHVEIREMDSRRRFVRTSPCHHNYNTKLAFHTALLRCTFGRVVGTTLRLRRSCIRRLARNRRSRRGPFLLNWENA